MKKSPLFLILLIALAMPTLSVAEQDANPVDTKSMLSTLRTLKEKQSDIAKAAKNRVIQDFAAAAANNASAIGFYEDAVRATQFQGMNRENGQFRDWRKKHEDNLKSRGMQNSVRLELTYLVLTLHRASGVEAKDLIPQLIAYCAQVLADPDLQDEAEMKKSVGSSIFAKWYNVSGLLSGIEKWEMTPGDVDGIFEKTILPYFRTTKDGRLLDYWNGKIDREAVEASRSPLAFTAAKFAESRKPVLLWNRAQDMMVLGQKNRAINEMFALIKAYPTHPDAPNWITTLEGILSANTASPSPAPAASSVTSPVAPPPVAAPAVSPIIPVAPAQP